MELCPPPASPPERQGSHREALGEGPLGWVRPGPQTAMGRPPLGQGCRFSRLTNGCAWNAVSAFANCGRASHASGAAMCCQSGDVGQPTARSIQHVPLCTICEPEAESGRPRIIFARFATGTMRSLLSSARRKSLSQSRAGANSVIVPSARAARKSKAKMQARRKSFHLACHRSQDESGPCQWPTAKCAIPDHLDTLSLLRIGVFDRVGQVLRVGAMPRPTPRNRRRHN